MRGRSRREPKEQNLAARLRVTGNVTVRLRGKTCGVSSPYSAFSWHRRRVAYCEDFDVTWNFLTKPTRHRDGPKGFLLLRGSLKDRQISRPQQLRAAVLHRPSSWRDGKYGPVYRNALNPSEEPQIPFFGVRENVTRDRVTTSTALSPSKGGKGMKTPGAVQLLPQHTGREQGLRPPLLPRRGAEG